MRRISTNLVHAQVLAPYARSLQAVGADVERLFASSSMALGAVFNESAMITMRQAHHLCETAARCVGDETFGATVGRGLNLKELGAMSDAICRAETLSDARPAVQHAAQATEPGSRLWIELDDTKAWFSYQPVHRSPGDSQSELFDLQCILKLIRLAGGETWIPREVRMSSKGAHMLNRVPEFSASAVRRSPRATAIAFPSSFLSRPLQKARGMDSWEAERGTRGSADGEMSVSTAVTLVLESLAKYGPIPSLEVMADRFGVSARTLQRALGDDGTSYRHLSERVLFRRSVDLLEDERLSVKKIADELSYSSPSHFTRAFRRISGVTPVAYRQAHLNTSL